MAVRKPKRPCSRPGCINLTRDRYCEKHQKEYEEQERARHQHYDEHKRDRRSAAFYKSVAWQRAREQVMMRDHRLCQECLKTQRITLATEVDHVIPIKVRWDLRLHLDNLQALCHRCHMRKTAEDKRKYGV